MEKYLDGTEIIFIGQKISKTSMPTNYKYHVKDKYKVLEVLKGNVEDDQVIEFIHHPNSSLVSFDTKFPQQEIIVLVRPKDARGFDAPLYKKQIIQEDSCNEYTFTYEDLVKELRKK